uniref:Uncharacterized protein n=1 Tax=Ixodes ricinus TaxID=34613 RepID=A0A6B0U657_IXORI
MEKKVPKNVGVYFCTFFFSLSSLALYGYFLSFSHFFYLVLCVGHLNLVTTEFKRCLWLLHQYMCSLKRYLISALKWTSCT